MNVKVKQKKGAKADVRVECIINFRTLDTKSRKDDEETWNAMQLYEETDGKESKYKPPAGQKLSKRAEQKILKFKHEKLAKIGRMSILAMQEVA